MRRFPGIVLALLVGLGATGVVDAQEQPLSEAEIVQLSKLVSRILQLGDFSGFLKADPYWPFQRDPGAVNEQQLACVRNGMGNAQMDKVILERVRKQAVVNPAGLRNGLHFLEGDGGLFIANILNEKRVAAPGQVGNSSEKERSTVDDVDQMVWIYQFMEDPQYRALRDLIVFPENTMSSESNAKSAGRSRFFIYVMPVLLNAMAECKVPRSVLFRDNKSPAGNAAKEAEDVTL